MTEALIDFFDQLPSNRIIVIIILIVAMWGISKLIRVLLNRISEKYAKHRIVIKNFIPIISILIYCLGVLAILFGVLKIAANTMMTIWVSAGVAIGLAFQDILSNVFSGLIIIFTHPFNIGDKIQTEKYYGEVVDINLLKVRIVTPDDSTVNIPSRQCLGNSVSNANSGQLDCQVVTEMSLPGNADLERAKDIAREAVNASPYSNLVKPVAVVFKNAMAAYPYTLMKVKSYVYDHRYEFAYASDLTMRIKKAFAAESLIPDDFYSPGQRLPAEGE